MTLHNCIRDMIVLGAAIGAGHHDRPRHNAARARKDGSPDDEDALGGYDG
jgi:hypothetical protein